MVERLKPWFGTVAVALSAGMASGVACAQASDKLSDRVLQIRPANVSGGQLQELLWVTDPSLELEQRLLKNTVVGRLRAIPGSVEAGLLAEFLESLPVTGRLSPVASDLATLLANPQEDYKVSNRSSVARRTVPQQATVLLPLLRAHCPT